MSTPIPKNLATSIQAKLTGAVRRPACLKFSSG